MLMNRVTLALLFSASMFACGAPVSQEGEGSTANQEVTEQSTTCPGSTKVYGIDVSVYQGTIDWAKVKAAGKQFAYIRVGDGLSLDSKFVSNWNGAKAAGLLVGTYLFFRPTKSATDQANFVLKELSAVKFGDNDLPPVLDVEVTDGASSATILSGVNTWISSIKSATGRLPALYTSPGFWGSMAKPTTLPYIWVANWGVSCPTLPPPWGILRFWQYSDTGSVSGISGNVDLDEYNGSLTELKGL